MCCVVGGGGQREGSTRATSTWRHRTSSNPPLKRRRDVSEVLLWARNEQCPPKGTYVPWPLDDSYWYVGVDHTLVFKRPERSQISQNERKKCVKMRRIYTYIFYCAALKPAIDCQIFCLSPGRVSAWVFVEFSVRVWTASACYNWAWWHAWVCVTARVTVANTWNSFFSMRQPATLERYFRSADRTRKYRSVFAVVHLQRGFVVPTQT